MSQAPDEDMGLSCTYAGPALPAAATAATSMAQLPTSNGYVAAVYVTAAEDVPVRLTDGSSSTSDQSHGLFALWDQLPRNPTADSEHRDLLWDLYMGVRADGEGVWLTEVAEDEVAYEPGTGIVRTVQTVGSLRIETHWFAPFQVGGARDVVVVTTVTNGGSAPAEVELFSLHNAHTGGEGSADGESVVDVAAPSNAVLESRSDSTGSTHLLHTPLGSPTGTAAAPAGHVYECNPYQRVTLGWNFDCVPSLWSGDDVAVGFQWDVGSLAPSASATRGLVLSWGEDAEALATRVDAFVASRDASTVLQAERDDWEVWHAAEAWPKGASDEERSLLAQSTAVLRMGQVRSDDSSNGQLLASLPPGQWTISWPRDAAYAVVALAASGHQDEAAAALQFMIDGDAGDYLGWLDLGDDVDDYLISVARSYGDGSEESDGATCSDGSDAGPNIELDNWGLFLWAFGAVATAADDDSWALERLDAVLDGVADPLVAAIEADTDLLIADSSIWERHWEECFPNGRKQFAYSSIQAVAGLREAARLAADVGGDDERAATYSAAAERLRAGLLRYGDGSDGQTTGPVFQWSTDDGQTCPVVASSPDEICEWCGPLDASVVELVNQGVVEAGSGLAAGTLMALADGLASPSGGPGLLRGDDGSGSSNPFPWYDDQEWVIIDLRMAGALAAVGRATGDATATANAEALLSWVTAVGSNNYGLIPELLSDGTYTSADDDDLFNPGVDNGGEAQGAMPMVGFGAGAYILAVQAVHGVE
jgi:GH15 family glucan-1,4-alpha-glucosidase